MTEYIENPLSGKLRGVTYENGKIIDVHIRDTDDVVKVFVPMAKWISVKDRLPEDDSDVLAYSRIGEESRIYPACYSNGVWFDCVFNAPATDTTTHWMKMPHPPKGE